MKLRAMMASLFAILMLTSCEDLFEDGNKPDGSNPDMKIASPTANRTFSVSQGVPVKVTLVDKDKVKDLSIVVNGSHGEPPLVNMVSTPDLKVVEIDTIVAQNTMQPGTYVLEITATDYRSNITKKDITFTLK